MARDGLRRLLSRLALAVAASAAAVMPACRTGPQGEASGGVSGAGLSLFVDGDTDVADFEVTVYRVSCDGEPITPFSVAVTEGPSDLSLSDKAGAAGSEHMFADAFIPLEAGCYDIVSRPLQASGDPSEDCAIAGADGVVVLDGKTTEIVLVSQCDGQIDVGAVDVLSVLNHPPQMLGAVFDPGKFVGHCEDQAVCVTLMDPDDDPLEIVWSQTGGPPLATLSPQPPTVNADGSVTQCALVEHAGPGAVHLGVTAYDLLEDPGGPGLVRFEDFYAKMGVTVASRDELIVPSYGVETAACP